MHLLTIEETFPLMKECFPSLDVKNLLKSRGSLTAFGFDENIGCYFVHPYKYGIHLAYFCIKKDWRHAGYCKKMLEFLVRFYSGGKPVYVEIYNSQILIDAMRRMGWYKLPIHYVRPEWGSEPVRRDFVLMCSKRDVEHINFIREFYEEFYKTKSEKLMQTYKSELLY